MSAKPNIYNHYISSIYSCSLRCHINKYASDFHANFGFDRSFVIARLSFTPLCICDNSAPCGPFSVGVTSFEPGNDAGDMSPFLVSDAGCFFAAMNFWLRQFMTLACATLTRPTCGRLLIVSLTLLHIRSAISSGGGGGSGRSSQSS